MEIYKTTFRGSEVSVIFTGSHYYFHNSYYGVIAVAERDYGKDSGSASHFTLSVGNRHTLGGSLSGAVESLVKRFITKSEQKYITKKVTYNTEEIDLADGKLSCEFISR